jgi:hypothetical protein
MVMVIKSSLFNDCALTLIGEIEPGLLPLMALGIHRCCQTKTYWKEYTYLEEGMIAVCVHSRGCYFLDKQITKEEISASQGRTRQGETSTANKPLLELGKKHHGRCGKGKPMFSSQS